MKSNRKNPLLAAFVSFTLAAPSAFAANLYWDGNGDTTGAGVTPTGTWGTNAFWNTTLAGNVTTPTNATTTSVDDLFFSAGADAVNAYTVTVNGSQTARLLTFEDGTATLSGGTMITLAGGGGVTVGASTVTGATISTALTLNGNNTFNVAASRTLTLDAGAFTRGTRATLNVQGAGTVTSTKTNLTAAAPWISFGTGTATTFAKFNGSTIQGLGYGGDADGVNAAASTDVVTGAGGLNYTTAATSGNLGTSASINTLRYTGGIGTLGTDTSFTTFGIMNSGTGKLTFSGAVTSGASTTELVVNTASGDIDFTGIFTGTITKTGSGTATLSSTVINAISLWSVNEGTLILTSAKNGTTEVIPTGTVNSGGTAKLGATDRVLNSAVFTVNAGGIFDINGFADLIGGISGAGSVTNTGTLVTLQLGNTTQTFSGVISGPLNLVKRTGGDQILSGANTFTGTTAITSPGTTTTLTLSNSLALQNSALATTSTSTGTATVGLKTTVTTLTFGGLTGNKDLASVFTTTGGYSGVTALTLNPGTGVTHSYSAVIANGAANMTLSKTGLGTQELTGTNTYTGSTTISDGTLKLSGSAGKLGSLGSYAGAISIGTGATFENASTGTQTLTGAISGAGTLSHTSTGQTILQTATNSFGALSVSNAGGRVFINTFASLPSAATVSVTTGNLVFDAGAQTYGNAITVGNGGALTARGASVLSNVALPGSGTVIFQNDDAVTSTLSVGGTQTLAGSLTVQIGGARTNANALGAVTLSGKLTGSGPLVVTNTGSVAGAAFGAGSLILSNATNDYTGGTTLERGTLGLGTNGTLGATTGALAVNNTNNVAAGKAVVLNLATAANTTVGNLSGTISTPTSGTNTATINTQTGRNFTVNQTADGTYAGVIAGAGSFALGSLSTHTLTLTGTNTHTGGTTLNRGTLGLDTNGTLGATTGALAVNNTNDAAAGVAVVLNLATAANTTVGSLSGTIATPTSGTNTATINTQTGRDFTVNQTADGTYAGVIAGDGNFALGSLSTHKLTLSGDNTYTGTTTISAGTLIVNGNQSAATGAVTVAAGTVTGTPVATLGGRGTIGGALTLAGESEAGFKNGGVLAPGDAGVDIQELKAGTTTWNGGSIWNFDLSSVNATSDKLMINGNFAKGSGTVGTDYTFNFMGSTPVWNTTYILAEWSGSLTGFTLGTDFSLSNLGVGPYGASSFAIVGNQLQFTAVPEPTSALVGLLIGAGLLRRRRTA